VSWQAIDKKSRTLLKAMPMVGAEGAQIDQLQALTGLAAQAVRESVKKLVTRSLVELRGLPKDPRYGIHQLTQTFLRGHLVDLL
jgi:hypothetical protein